MQIDAESYCTTSTATCSKKAGKHTKLRNLKVVKLEGFTNQEEEITLAERLQEIVTVDPLILATSDGIRWRSLVKDAEMATQSSDTRCSYKFVQEVKHRKEFPIKHTQMGL